MSSPIKFLTLNLFKGLCLQEVIQFINREKFDIVHLQEVSGDFISFKQDDCFRVLQEATKMKGELCISWNHFGNKNAYFGNATFYNPSFTLKERVDLRYKPYQEIGYPDNPPVPEHPRNSLFLHLDCKGRDLWFVNTHQAWGPTPTDEPYKIQDAQLLAKAIEKIGHPFVLSGDFNMVQGTEVIRSLEHLGRNLCLENKVCNTLNPKVHRAKDLFPPGLGVDIIFTHPSLKIANFKLIDNIRLSDHFGIQIELL